VDARTTETCAWLRQYGIGEMTERLKGVLCILGGIAAAGYSIWSLISHQAITISRGSALAPRSLDGWEAMLYNILFLGIGIAGVVFGIRLSKTSG